MNEDPNDSLRQHDLVQVQRVLLSPAFAGRPCHVQQLADEATWFQLFWRKPHITTIFATKAALVSKGGF